MMEYPAAFNKITVLKVKSICCESYHKKLKKKLSKLDGVCTIDINPEKNLVRITGRVDANSLINTVAKTGKYAEILSLNQDPEETNCKNSCFQGNSFNDRKEKRQHQREYHRCENYVPPGAEHLCRDRFCRNHGRRTMFRDSVPAASNDFYHGPFEHYRHQAHGRDKYGPQWFVEEPWLPSNLGDGYNPGRPCHGFENGSGCVIL